MENNNGAFGSTTERYKLSAPTPSTVGPGRYDIPSTLRRELPAFVPFSSTSGNAGIRTT